jgi:hypothetical protein
MVGFRVTVDSNIGYSSSEYNSWTEGDLWLAKKALSKFAVKGTAMFMPDLLGAIESQFKTIRKVLTEQVGGIDQRFFVGIYGSVFMFIEFNPTDSPSYTVWKLLETIRRSNVEFGDQVMIQICFHISEFDKYIGLQMIDKVIGSDGFETAPIMNITLSL